MNKQRLKILCVEDDHDDCLFLKQAIHEIAPIEIEFAFNGAEALDILKVQKHIDDLPSLIILDINMPIMNGTKTLQEIRKDSILKTIPVVIFTTAKNPFDDPLSDVEVLIKPTDWESYSKIAMKLLTYCGVLA